MNVKRYNCSNTLDYGHELQRMCSSINDWISFYNSISSYDLGLINMNAAFKPDTETQRHLRWYRDNVLRVQNKLMQLHELLCPDYFPDWEDDECKCYIYYHYKKNEWCCDNIQYMKEFIVYFNAKTAKKACEILNKEKFMMDKV